jgi:hypothetical protein
MTKKTSIVIIFINLVLVGALVAVNFVLTVPKETVTTRATARLGALVGEVHVRKQGQNKWVRARVGDLLKEGDEIRTGVFSEGTLHVQGESSVVISSTTNFVIGKSRIKRSSFELGIGQITADIPKGSSREYRFESRGSDAVASANEGEFNLASDGKGTVVVDARVGNVKFKAKGKEIVVKKGKRSIVLPNSAPSKALEIPKSVALQVKWPSTKTDRKKTTVVGTTSAGALVMVNGIQVRADKQGQFSLDIPLSEGSNRVVVNVTDNAGNSVVEQSPEILVDTKPPAINVDAKDLWK